MPKCGIRRTPCFSAAYGLNRQKLVEFRLIPPREPAGPNFEPHVAAVEFKPQDSADVYPLDVARTVHFLLACLDPRGATLNEQAAVEKGKMLVEWLDSTSVLIAGNIHFCSIFKAHALAGDDWGAMLTDFEQRARRDCPNLFA